MEDRINKYKYEYEILKHDFDDSVDFETYVYFRELERKRWLIPLSLAIVSLVLSITVLLMAFLK
ncbi:MULTISPECIES: hypothetical protein [Helcococcus]|uniref:Uncharacterized protein n=1 Tax=Helcococcus bovis TaxID=3153252 RepID=A0ABW9F756_9FIRM